MENPETAPAEPRWFRRAVPVTGLLVALVALAALLSPGVRHQLALSMTRQAQPYVEMYFPLDPSGARAACARDGADVQVSFTVTSHLEAQERLAYRVAVTPAAAGAEARREHGWVRVDPGASREVRARLPLAAGRAYTAEVTLPGLDQQLRVHCDGARS